MLPTSFSISPAEFPVPLCGTIYIIIADKASADSKLDSREQLGLLPLLGAADLVDAVPMVDGGIKPAAYPDYVLTVG